MKQTLILMILGVMLFAVPMTANAKETTKQPANATEQTIGEYIDDAAITTEIKARILAEKGLDSFDISVETTDGSTTLSGMVDNDAQVKLAERVAMDVKGVKKVVNNLKTK